MNRDTLQPNATSGGTWPCHLDCEYARSLPGDQHPDWLMCHRPHAARLVVPLGDECQRFEADRPGEPEGATPATPLFPKT